MDLNFIVGGPQGGGIETAGLLAVRALSMQGLEVFADREYHSNIKGKHSYSHIRASENRVRSIKYPIDLLGALDAETMATHFQEVRKGGMVIHDRALSKKQLTKIPSMEGERGKRLVKTIEEEGIGDSVEGLDGWLEGQGIAVLAIPFGEILTDRAKLGSPMIERAMNTALTSALLLSAGIPISTILRAITSLFREKKDVADLNVAVAAAVSEEFEEIAGTQVIKPAGMESKENEKGRRMLVAGNDAVAIGKLLGGLRLQTYYPITPAADESFVIEQHSELRNPDGVTIGSPVVIQAEDEIAAICMAIGGALAGVRSATCTSGPGFSLMVEGIGWAGNNEVPVVITYYQRGGPSTGLPTRHSQSDLLFSIHSGHGEFSRIVLASGDHLEALNDAIKCMNLAERYQVPVIHLLDKGLANCMTTIPGTFLKEIERGERYRGGAGYKRFAIGRDPVSPRAYLGEELMWYTGDEHDETGHISEDPRTRMEMYEKRMKKREKIIREAKNEDKAVLFGDPEFDDLMVTWGITTGAAVDAMSELNSSGSRVSVLQVRMMEPFPSDFVGEYLSKAADVVSVEANYFGQLAELIGCNCGVPVKKRVLKYTGRLITQDEIVSAFRRVKGGEERVVLSGGE